VSDPRNAGVKTLGIKLTDELHAQFAMVCQVDDLNLSEGVKAAVELYVETKRSAPDFKARAQAIVEEIERKALAERNAIQALFGAEGSDTTSVGDGDVAGAGGTTPAADGAKAPAGKRKSGAGA
jgi:hypothetical protein